MISPGLGIGDRRRQSCPIGRQLLELENYVVLLQLQLTAASFAQLFGPQSVSELTGEYQLARFLRLQANTAQGPGSRTQRSLLQRTERFGLDLIFFFNY